MIKKVGLFLVIIILLVIIVIILYSLFNKKTEIVGNVKSIIIYDISYEDGVNNDNYSLNKEIYKEINNPSLTYYKDAAIWKGDRFGVMKLEDGREKNIKVSVYGDFFRIPNTKGYYVYKD